jgi:hypothetical protein
MKKKTIMFISADGVGEEIEGEENLPKEYHKVRDGVKEVYDFEGALVVNGTYNVMFLLNEDAENSKNDDWSVLELEKDENGDFMIENEITGKNFEEILHYSVDIIKKNAEVVNYDTKRAE